MTCMRGKNHTSWGERETKDRAKKKPCPSFNLNSTLNFTSPEEIATKHRRMSGKRTRTGGAAKVGKVQVQEILLQGKT